MCYIYFKVWLKGVSFLVKVSVNGTILYAKKVRGSILIGILVTWILGMICEATGVYTVHAEAGFYSLFPAWSSFDLGAIGTTFGQCFNVELASINWVDFLVIMAAFLFGELPTPLQLLGGALVIGGVAVYSRLEGEGRG